MTFDAGNRWVWVSIRAPENRMFESLVPFPKLPCWVRLIFFDPKTAHLAPCSPAAPSAPRSRLAPLARLQLCEGGRHLHGDSRGRGASQRAPRLGAEKSRVCRSRSDSRSLRRLDEKGPRRRSHCLAAFGGIFLENSTRVIARGWWFSFENWTFQRIASLTTLRRFVRDASL